MQAKNNCSNERFIGFIPLAIFIYGCSIYFATDSLANILWLCNVSNLLLAMGFFLSRHSLILIATMWLIAVFPIWVFDVSVGDAISTLSLHSFFSHVVSLAIALLYLSVHRHNIIAVNLLWLKSLTLLLAIQTYCMFFTPVEFNVNLSHAIYESIAFLFSSYLTYWLANTMLAAIIFWILEKALINYIGR